MDGSAGREEYGGDEQAVAGEGNVKGNDSNAGNNGVSIRHPDGRGKKRARGMT